MKKIPRVHRICTAACILTGVSGIASGAGYAGNKWYCDDEKRIQIPGESVIPSGGQGGNETISEALAMKGYLLEHGVAEEHIILEDKSLNTMENLKNSMDIINSREGRHRVALVTSNYHVYRCLIYAKSLNLKCTGIGAPVAWYYWPSAVIREFVAVFTTRKFLLWTVTGYILVVLLPVWGYAKMG